MRKDSCCKVRLSHWLTEKVSASAVITGAEIMSLRTPTLFFLFILPSLEVGFDNEYWKKLGVLAKKGRPGLHIWKLPLKQFLPDSKAEAVLMDTTPAYGTAVADAPCEAPENIKTFNFALLMIDCRDIVTGVD